MLNVLVFSGLAYRFKNRPKIEIHSELKTLKVDVDGANVEEVERFISLTRKMIV